MKIKSIKRVEDCELQCINVSTPDGLYVTDDNIITHNSVIGTANNLQWKTMSSPGSLLGLNLLVGAMTELTFFLEAGKGWALKDDTEILMEDGSLKKIRDIQIGDRLAHPDNKENAVVDIPFDEEADDIELTLDSGKTIICNYHHIWKVSFRKDRDGEKIWDLVETGFIVEHPELEFEIPEI